MTWNTKIKIIKIQIKSKLLQSINDIQKKGNYVNDIFSNYEVTEELKKDITKINITLSDIQYMSINKIVNYKNGNNYFGELYHKYKNDQLESTKIWVKHFYPNKPNLLDTFKKKLKSLKN